MHLSLGLPSMSDLFGLLTCRLGDQAFKGSLSLSLLLSS